MWLQANDDLLIHLENGIRIHVEDLADPKQEQSQLIYSIPAGVSPDNRHLVWNSAMIFNGSLSVCRKRLRKIKLTLVVKQQPLIDFTLPENLPNNSIYDDHYDELYDDEPVSDNSPKSGFPYSYDIPYDSDDPGPDTFFEEQNSEEQGFEEQGASGNPYSLEEDIVVSSSDLTEDDIPF